MDPNEQYASSTIVLIGPMGVGKTSVGRSLAAMLDTNFYDTDVQIEKMFGVPGSSISQTHGVQYLHDAELNIFVALAGDTAGGVIACAESVIDTTTGRRILGLTQSVWLDATPDDLAERRLSSDHRRGISAQEASALRNAREHHLAERTQLRLDTSTMNIDQCAAQIHQWLTEQNA